MEGGYSLRWFTPATEVDLCGHATLSSAHVLFNEGYAKHGEEIAFHTRSGVLRAWLREDMIELDFPIKEPEPAEAPPYLIEAMRVVPRHIGRNQMDYLVEIGDEQVLQDLAPDIALLSRAEARGVIATSRSAGYDFVSRFFAPRVGVPEDPVTGSAYCCLAPYWARKLGENTFYAYQASRRGGELWLSLRGDRVLIRGYAATVYA